ncbi:hypothetical protein [Streptomyces shenzhenensis]
MFAAGACGAYDDLAGAGDPRRGFRAHPAALRDADARDWWRTPPPW